MAMAPESTTGSYIVRTNGLRTQFNSMEDTDSSAFMSGTTSATFMGVIAAAILALLCLVLLALWYTFKHKGTYITNECGDLVDTDDSASQRGELLLETVDEKD
ncbi:small cell adhesion glycoprotein homolog isoform X2 [Esox lucius]|uniref:small cell adhesion glycoprotein homolog isoform X2 n=1 Tax=Esox lucius TaxID=8010 RepID=UPI000576A8A7|nr:small cell adhesion glycoprotein homolog isoform X2 [Esox lucius]